MGHNYYAEINLHVTWHVKESAPLLVPKVEAIVHHHVRGKCINTQGAYIHEIDGTETHLNLAISIAIESAELLEHFQWKNYEESEKHAVDAKEQIADEAADVAVYLIELCDNLGIDLETAIHSKLEKNAAKYPATRARGTAKKYTDL